MMLGFKSIGITIYKMGGFVKESELGVIQRIYSFTHSAARHSVSSAEAR